MRLEVTAETLELGIGLGTVGTLMRLVRMVREAVGGQVSLACERPVAPPEGTHVGLLLLLLLLPLVLIIS